MRVDQIMTRAVITVASQATLAAALDLLIEHRVGGLPVLDESSRLCGILSEGDLLHRMELGTQAEPKSWWWAFGGSTALAEAYSKANGRRVADVMSPMPVTVDADASLMDAADLMEKRKFRLLPVISGGVLVGIVTRADFVRALRQAMARRVSSPAASDEAIRTAILTVLGKQRWAVDCSIDVSVSSGRVKLEGGVFNDDQRRAAIVVAESIDGVTSIDDKLQLFETVVVPGL